MLARMFFFPLIITTILIIGFPRELVISDFRSYYSEYKALFPPKCFEHYHTRRFYIDFAPPDNKEIKDGVIGVCYRKVVGDDNAILIDKGYWLSASNQERRQLLFHELAHCTIRKQHVDQIGNYMYPSVEPVSHVELIQQASEDIQEACSKI